MAVVANRREHTQPHGDHTSVFFSFYRSATRSVRLLLLLRKEQVCTALGCVRDGREGCLSHVGVIVVANRGAVFDITISPPLQSWEGGALPFLSLICLYSYTPLAFVHSSLFNFQLYPHSAILAQAEPSE